MDTIVMTNQSLLGLHKIIAFVGTRHPDAAKKFYRDTLGLRLTSEDKFALVFDVDGTMLRVSMVQELTPAKYTVLGWQVPDIVATVKELQNAGVKLEQYGLKDQDELGIWTAPGGARVARFKDPDANTLSVTQF